MIATLMINKEKEVCLAQFDDHLNVKRLRLLEGDLCAVDTQDGDEEMFTETIDPILIEALRHQSNILVAHIGADGLPFKEYEVPLSYLD